MCVVCVMCVCVCTQEAHQDKQWVIPQKPGASPHRLCAQECVQTRRPQANSFKEKLCQSSDANTCSISNILPKASHYDRGVCLLQDEKVIPSFLLLSTGF